jgi:hypothetical protein
MDTDYAQMIGTERTVTRQGVELAYRVEGIKRKGQTRWTGPTVTVYGQCIEDKPQEGHPNATWYGSYCAEIFHV